MDGFPMKNFFLILIFYFLSAGISFSQTCSRNVINCKGICGRFTDSDGDSICDLSPKSEPEKVAKPLLSSQQSTEKVLPKKKDTTVKQVKNAAVPVSKEKKQSVQDSVKTTVVSQKDTTLSTVTSNNAGKEQKSASSQNKPYPLIEIILLTLGIYLTTFLLVKFKVIKKITHRKIWNMLLLLTFLMSGLLGLLLVFQLNYQFWMSNFCTFMTLHVDFGISMAIISVFHAIWHWTYYKNLLKKRD